MAVITIHRLIAGIVIFRLHKLAEWREGDIVKASLFQETRDIINRHLIHINGDFTKYECELLRHHQGVWAEIINWNKEDGVIELRIKVIYNGSYFEHRYKSKFEQPTTKIVD
jgi:hypothetical protein